MFRSIGFEPTGLHAFLSAAASRCAMEASRPEHAVGVCCRPLAVPRPCRPSSPALGLPLQGPHSAPRRPPDHEFETVILRRRDRLRQDRARAIEPGSDVSALQLSRPGPSEPIGLFRHGYVCRPEPVPESNLSKNLHHNPCCSRGDLVGLNRFWCRFRPELARSETSHRLTRTGLDRDRPIARARSLVGL